MVSLRDGKSYDTGGADLGASSGSSRPRRQSTATATTGAPRPTRRSARGATSNSAEAGLDEAVAVQPQEEVATPARGKRQRSAAVQQQLMTTVPDDSAADDADVLDRSDVVNTDQGRQLLAHAAAMALPDDDASPTPKKPRIPVGRSPTPSKAAAAACKLRKDTLAVSMCAALMVLVAALTTAALLPGFEPHRAQFRASVQQTASHISVTYLQPATAQAMHSFAAARVQLAGAAAGVQRQAQAALSTVQQQGRAALSTVQQQGRAVLLNTQQQGQEVVSLVQQQGQVALLQAQLYLQQAQELLVVQWEKLQGAMRGPASAQGPPGAWPIDSLVSIFPGGAHWADYASGVAEKLQAPAAARGLKAPALLLACGSADDCNEAAAALAVLPPKGEACTLTLDSSSFASDSTSEPAATLQATLAPFLRRCPAGLVVVRGAEVLPVAAVPALHTALSEQGSFQHDGPVDASRAAYALLLQLQPSKVAELAASPDTAAVDAAIKDSFFKGLNAQLQQAAAAAPAEAAAHWDAVQRAVSTLHRRIEFAAPVRQGASSEAEAPEGAAAAAA